MNDTSQFEYSLAAAVCLDPKSFAVAADREERGFFYPCLCCGL